MMKRNIRKNAFTLVELLVVITIIGILIALLLPAIQAAREAARQMQCCNNLKQIGLALHNFHDARGGLPPTQLSPYGHLTWLAIILPYMEQKGLADSLDMERSVYVAPNYPDGIRTQIAAYLCPTRRAPPQLNKSGGVKGGVEAIGALCDYAINVGDYRGTWYQSQNAHGASRPPRWGTSEEGTYYSPSGSVVSPGTYDSYLRNWKCPRTFGDITDGLSNTLMVGEKHIVEGHLCEWQYGDDVFYSGDAYMHVCRLAGRTDDSYWFPLAASPADPMAPFAGANYNYDGIFGSWHSNGLCGFVFADGSIQKLSPLIDIYVLDYLANIHDGHPIPGNAF